jgi:hypothetical protein
VTVLVKNSLKVLIPFFLLLCQQVTAGDFGTEEQSFDDIDKMLERKFQQTNAQIDQVYDAYNKAISDAFDGITKKIQVEWPDNVRLPQKSVWVGYSKDLKTRSIVDYQQGALVIEAKVSNKNLDQARLEIEAMAKRLSADKNVAIAELDLFTSELKSNLVKRGIEVSDDIAQAQGEKPNILKQILPTPQTIASLALTLPKQVMPAEQHVVIAEPAPVQPTTENASELVNEPLTSIVSIANKETMDTHVAKAQTSPIVDKVQQVVIAQAAQVQPMPDKLTEPVNKQLTSIERITNKETVEVGVAKAQLSPVVDKVQQVVIAESAPELIKKENITGLIKKPITSIQGITSVAQVAGETEQVLPIINSDNKVQQVAATVPAQLTSKAIVPAVAALTVVKTSVALNLQSPKVSNNAPDKPEIKLELVKQGELSILKMSIKFVNKYQEILLSHNFNDVKKYSAKYDVPISVILAIIETESSYNPRAVSNVPAFGLMQLVPKTAGVDAHNYVFGEKKIVTADYLFDQSHNIQLGTAYFKLLKSRYLRKIKDPISRFYCAVASYNTGVGNLAKTFTGHKNLSKAALEINKLSPAQVYAYLLEHLPAEETRNYLKKIVKRTNNYLHFDVNTEES